MEELKKSADLALQNLKTEKKRSDITSEEKKTLEENLNDAQSKWEAEIKKLETNVGTDESKKIEAVKWRNLFDEFKKLYDTELKENQQEAQDQAQIEQNKDSEATNALAAEVGPKIGTYSIEKLKSLIKKSWKELWVDVKYIKTIQQIIIDTGAKHNSISNEILTNGIYGRGTKAGIKTLQEYLNKTYNANLIPDGLAGPATLQALLVIVDGDKTILDQIIADHSSVTPLEPEVIKATKAKAKITAPIITDTEEPTVNGEVKDKALNREEALRNPSKYNLIKDKNNKLEPADGYAWIDYKDTKNLNVQKLILQNNKIESITSLDQLPSQYKWNRKNNVSFMYKDPKTNISYRFYDTGKVAVFTDIKKTGKMEYSKDIITKLQNTTDKKIIDNIDPYNSTIEKNYKTYLKELFKTMSKTQQEYYKKYIGIGANITCTSDNPDIILHINKAEIRLQKSDYLKSDGKTVNYNTINQTVLNYIDTKIKENKQKERDKNIQTLKDKLENLNDYTINTLFPNTKDQKIKDFFALFSGGEIEFDNINSTKKDKNQIEFIFDISGPNSDLIKGKMNGKINIRDIIKENKIDEGLFQEQLKKNIINNLNNAKKTQDDSRKYQK